MAHRTKLDAGAVGPQVIEAGSSGADLLGVRLSRLVEHLNELKSILYTRLIQYHPHQPNDPSTAMEATNPIYNYGSYFDQRFIELDDGFKLIDECKEAIHRAEI